MTRGGWVIWLTVAFVGAIALSHKASIVGLIEAMLIPAVVLITVWMGYGWLTRARHE